MDFGRKTCQWPYDFVLLDVDQAVRDLSTSPPPSRDSLTYITHHIVIPHLKSFTFHIVNSS